MLERWFPDEAERAEVRALVARRVRVTGALVLVAVAAGILVGLLA